MVSAYTGVLHTKASEFGNSIQTPNNFIQRPVNIQSKITSLQNKEMSVYQSFGCSSLQNFIKRIKELFGSNSYDATFFRFFESENIRQCLISKFGAEQIGGGEIKIHIKNENNKVNLAKYLSGIPNVTLDQSNSTIIIGMGPSAKAAFNELFGTKLSTKSKDQKQLRKLLKDPVYLTSKLKDGTTPLIVTGSNVSDTAFSYNLQPTSIFSYNAKDIADSETNQELRNKLIEMRAEIKHFIMTNGGYSGCSGTMRLAFEKVWKSNIESAFTNLALFEKNGVINGLVGAFGEFQTALLFEYVNLCCGSSNNAGFQAIISDTLRKGEQAKSDVTILNNIGIQVKNYNTIFNNSRSTQLKTNIHPDKFVQYFPSSDTTNFFDFLANYFFNRTFQSERGGDFVQLEKQLSDLFGEVANMDFDLNIEDTVTFYFIGGKYFVPGSDILIACMLNRNMAKIPEITGPKTAYSDEEFAQYRVGETGHKSLLSKYWKNTDGSWIPTFGNKTEYDNLIRSKISIRSGFDYTQLNLKTYSLF